MGINRPNVAISDEENSGILLDQPEFATSSLYSFVAGTIKTTQEEYMKKLLFRITRGKALTYF